MDQMKILLAEDDLDDQELFIDFINKRKDIILMPVVENGVALFEILSKIENGVDLPDMIILDQNMPLRNGLQTLQLLKENTKYAHIPVVIYSTFTDDRLIHTCSAFGASLVFAKPISKEGYEKMIDDFLKFIQK